MTPNGFFFQATDKAFLYLQVIRHSCPTVQYTLFIYTLLKSSYNIFFDFDTENMSTRIRCLTARATELELMIDITIYSQCP